MARRMEFRKSRLGEYTAASSLCLCQHPPEVSHCSHNRISVSSGKGLNFITNNVVLLLKCDGNYNWFDLHTIFFECWKYRSWVSKAHSALEDKIRIPKQPSNILYLDHIKYSCSSFQWCMHACIVFLTKAHTQTKHCCKKLLTRFVTT